MDSVHIERVKTLVILLFGLSIYHLAMAMDHYGYSMKVVSIESDSLVAQFEAPPSIIASQSKQWIGLWKGKVYPANLSVIQNELVTSARIHIAANGGSVGLNNANLARNSDYTLVYFASEGISQPVTLIHFNTSEKVEN